MAQGPRRLLFLAAQYFPAVGGSETQARLLARELRQRGHDVRVWTRRLEASHPAFEAVDDVAVTRLGPTFASPAAWTRRIERLAFTARLFRDLQRGAGSFDVVFANQLQYPAAAAALACRGLAPVAARSATSGPEGEMHRLEWSFRIQRWILTRYLDRVVALGPHTRADCERAGFPASRLVIIPNGLASAAFEASGPPRDPSAPLRLLWLGRFRKEKRADLALAAWREAAIAGEFRLVGDGPGRAAVEAQVNEGAGLASTVRLAGLVEDPGPELRAAHVYLQSSDTEGLSNALLEAMAAGCACIATDVGETRFVLGADQGSSIPAGSYTEAAAGLLVRAGDAKGMAAALRALVDPARRDSLGRVAQTRCRANHAIAAVARKYEELFEDLVRAPRGRRAS